MTGDKIDGKLLNLVQTEFPLSEKPFAELGRCLGIAAGEVIDRIGRLKAAGIVREISAVIDGRRLGYQPTLVAMRVPHPSLARVEDVIRRHPGVSHGYERDHQFNVWFTLALPRGADVGRELESLTSGLEVEAAFALPAVKMFKIGAYFDVGGDGNGSDGATISATGALPEPVRLSQQDRLVIRALQQDLPLVPSPFAEMAARAGMSADSFIAACRALERRGIMRRFGASVNHRRAGFEGNGMACWVVPPGRVLAVGQGLASLPEVSHCYERETNPLWRHNMFAMIHGRSRQACQRVAARATRQMGLAEPIVLFSTKEFKKERVRYLA